MYKYALFSRRRIERLIKSQYKYNVTHYSLKN